MPEPHATQEVATERRASPMSSSIIWIGMDVHKDTVMVAVYRGDAREAELFGAGYKMPTGAAGSNDSGALTYT